MGCAKAVAEAGRRRESPGYVRKWATRRDCGKGCLKKGSTATQKIAGLASPPWRLDEWANAVDWKVGGVSGVWRRPPFAYQVGSMLPLCSGDKEGFFKQRVVPAVGPSQTRLYSFAAEKRFVRPGWNQPESRCAASIKTAALERARRGRVRMDKGRVSSLSLGWAARRPREAAGAVGKVRRLATRLERLRRRATQCCQC
jgi:hypothetical protein